MSNLAGKAYAMNLVTPIQKSMTFVNKTIFSLVGTELFKSQLLGLLTLSMIHYARWVIIRDDEFPRLDPSQPEEDLNYDYMFFFSNFNGSWAQYIDSFSIAIPGGLDLLWYKNVGWPTAVPETPFHSYVDHNQVWTDYYYSAYPMAASNDIKAAARVKTALVDFAAATAGATPDAFRERYNRLLRSLQADLGEMGPTPVASLAAEAVQERRRDHNSGYHLAKKPSVRVA